WFYTGGDERNRLKERGSIAPGVPAFLTGSSLNIQPVSLPPRAWYPGLKPAIQQTVLAEARAAMSRAEQDLKAAQESSSAPRPELLPALKEAEAAFEPARRDAEATKQPGALAGQQSLAFDATTGRRIVQNGLQSLKGLPDGSTLSFQLQLITDV